MKLLIIILVCVCFLEMTSHAQEVRQSNSFDRFSLKLEDIPLSVALDSVAKTCGISFSYSARKIQLNQKVSVDHTGSSVQELLDAILGPIGISYTLISGKYVLKQLKIKEVTHEYTVSGYITDRSDGETLIGAVVSVPSLALGAVANAYGFYSLTLPSGEYEIQYSYIGYTGKTLKLELMRDATLPVELTPDIAQLEELIVTPSDSVTSMEDIHNNSITFDHQVVENKPVSLGEPDVIKALESLPGIQLFRDGSTYFNVRGGARDQNQILVDEAPIYNPAHFLGLFSSIIPEVTKDIKVYRGDLPARLGGRISSVMDIKTREGDMKEFHVSGNMGFVAGRVALEGPIKKDKSSFFVSGRRSYIFDLLRLSDSEITSLFFSDFTAKANFDVNEKNRLYISTYSGRDEFLTDGGITWENTAATVRWNHIYNEKLFSNTTIYTSRYEYNLIGDPESNIRWTNSISNATLKMDFMKYINPRETLSFGFRASGHQFNPGNIEDSFGNVPDGQLFIPKRNATDFSLYASKEHEVSKAVLLTYGLRLSTWSNYGRTIEYTFNEQFEVIDSTIYNTRGEYNSYANLEPRFSFTYLKDKDQFYKLNYSRSAQYINLISNSISPFNNLEVWLPASINIKPQISDQLSLGWFWMRRKWDLSIETYYKWMGQQLDYVDQARLTLNPHLEGELRAGDGRSYGVELKVSKKSGLLTGWISYAYARALRTIPGINGNKEYPTLWDRPHQVNMQLAYKASKRSTFNATFLLSSGSPVTTPIGFYEFSGRQVPLYGDKNNGRLPTYHRFDVAMKYRLNKIPRRFTHYLTFSLFNFYAQENDISQAYSKRRESQDSFVVPADLNNAFDVEATRLFVYSLIPSVSYSFKW